MATNESVTTKIKNEKASRVDPVFRGTSGSTLFSEVNLLVYRVKSYFYFEVFICYNNHMTNGVK